MVEETFKKHCTVGVFHVFHVCNVAVIVNVNANVNVKANVNAM